MPSKDSYISWMDVSHIFGMYRGKDIPLIWSLASIHFTISPSAFALLALYIPKLVLDL